MSEYSGSSPHRAKVSKTEAYRASKQTKQGEDVLGRMAAKRPPQPPLHIRVLQSKSQEPSRFDAPSLPRRTRSTPAPVPNLFPSRHIPPPSIPSPQPRHPDTTPPMPHKLAQSVTTAKKIPPLVSQLSSTSQQPDAAKQKLIDRAVKGRLYLLHKTGPTRFLIGGDAPDSRFHVTIGPQSCTCNKSLCIHLLFVMLRVLKVSQNDPLLWQKQLRNYEAESLLREFQARVSMRSTPKKTSKKRFDFAPRRSPDMGRRTPTLVKSASDEKDQPKPKTPDSPPLTESEPKKLVFEDEGEEGEREEEEAEVEEDVCPICLNELDEGEDLMVCAGCHNRLHHHCMDIWAREQRRKNEDVHCPVCRAHWSYATPTVSPSSGPNFMPVLVPVGGEREWVVGGLRLKSVMSPGRVVLSAEKANLVERLKSVFGPGTIEYLFSSDWKARETTLSHLSRELITFLLPLLSFSQSCAHDPPSPGGGGSEEKGRIREIQGVCLQVVTYACNDSVLKVFLAALEMLRVILGYSVCYTREEADHLRSLLRPILLVLLSRCADAQRRVKECSIDTMCNLCLGQEGPLSIGSACGRQSLFSVSDTKFVLECALNRDEDRGHSWHWWLGRLNFLDRLIATFSWEFLLKTCILVPPQDSGMDSGPASSTVTPHDSITSAASTLDENPFPSMESRQTGSMESEQEGGMESGQDEPESQPAATGTVEAPPPSSPENNLLVQAWYFAAKATHTPHNKVGKVGKRVIIRIAKVLRDDPSSLEIVHDVVMKCHRTSAEGLLDRVLKAREKPHEPIEHKRRSTGESRRAKQQENANTKPPKKVLIRSPSLDVERSLLPSSASALALTLPEHPSELDRQGGEGEAVLSDDSFRSAVSDLDAEKEEGAQGGSGRNESSEGLEGSSSASNSHDSKSDERPRSGVGAEGASGGGGPKIQRYYTRQSTADSVFSTDSSMDSGYASGYFCKRNIEEEEAEEEARVRSMLPEDPPHPLLSLHTPSPEVLLQVQPNRKEDVDLTDGVSRPYLEGEHWVKGKLIGTGAFCTCFLARDVKNGTMFAVKQVSYVRNTQSQEEEELRRLKEEIAMLGRLSHPNIVRCLGATQHMGHINIFIEWMAGGCLDQLLHDFGPFAESVICSYTRQMVYGIVYLHENGIIHRDLKGGNVLVDSTGQRVRIADFGAAARLASHTTGPGEFQDMEGTVAFMAPEVVRGGSFDEVGAAKGYGRKCDVWSIGCVIIQMATAKPPWVGSYDVRNKYQLIFRIGQATSPPPMPNFSDPALKDFTIRCLEINPDDRPISSELLKHTLFTQA